MALSAVGKALVTARQKCLSEEEAYWAPDLTSTGGPISPRNEAAALSWLLDHQAVVCRGGEADVAELHRLCAQYCASLGAAAAPEDQAEGAAEGEGEGAEAPSTSGRSFDDASAEAALHRWCTQRGMTSLVAPARFATRAGPLRGLAATAHVAPGDVVLHVPQDELLSYDTAKGSDLGKVLAALPLGLDDDTIALIWTCVERREPEAQHGPFWAALPQRFATLLSAPDSALALLEGAPLHREAVTARKHLRDAFSASGPAFASLLGAYPDYFQPDWFSWESYLWAAELWYSYGIQVQHADGAVRTCLAPLLGLMNHNALPHIVHFSKVDPASRCLRVRAFRPCAAGRQLFLSYGPYPNAKLLLFYGFALAGNPFDEVELALQAPADAHAADRSALLSAAGLGLQHRLRPGGAPLAPPLLACARVLAASPAQLTAWRHLPAAELKKGLLARAGSGAGAGGGSDEGLDGAARGVVAAAVRAVLQGVEGSRERAAAAAAAAAEQAKGQGQGGEEAQAEQGLLHFVQVYVEGAAGILRGALRSLEAA